MRHFVGITLLVVLLSGCAPQRSHIERIKADGALVVAMRNSPATYYHGPLGATGFEYELTTLFAQHIGVQLKPIVEENYPRMFSMLRKNKVDLAAGLNITDARKTFLRFGPAYMQVTPQIVYRFDYNKKLRNVEEMIDQDIEVAAKSSHAETLAALAKHHPRLSWHENHEHDDDGLLQLVWSQLVDYTVVNSTEIKLVRRLYPELTVAFAIGEAEDVAWATHHGDDDSLHQAIVDFFRTIQANGTLKQLIGKYYGHVERLNYVDVRNYQRDIAHKLPDYIDIFKLSAHAQHLDWRLLAAVSYQESHWNPRAVSPTGVRGIMMLTQDTAKFVGIDSRIDALQSIEGGAKYLRYMINKIPEHIAEPDRTWMALAAYNIGYGHLEDARIITQSRGGSADKWVDVKESLPLLRQKRWYSKTEHGYARGDEPVGYVENIRNYYEILVWRDKLHADREKQKLPRAPISVNATAL